MRNPTVFLPKLRFFLSAKLLKDTVKHSKTNKQLTQTHRSVNISKKLPNHMFVIENKCFYSTAIQVKTKRKTAKGP